jgi:hypothetical protein
MEEPKIDAPVVADGGAEQEENDNGENESGCPCSICLSSITGSKGELKCKHSFCFG